MDTMSEKKRRKIESERRVLSTEWTNKYLFIVSKDKIPMLSGSTVTTAWRVLGLRIEETASRY
jgi:hypothetical protein